MRPSSPYIWPLILVIGAGTYALRLSFIQLLSRARESRRFERILRFVPAAVMSALVLPALFLEEATAAASPAWARLVAGAIAALVAWWSRSVLLTLVSGMSALWILQEVL